MKCTYACGTAEHAIARRSFLGGLVAGVGAVGGMGIFARPAAARTLEQQQRRVLVIFMSGGVSQLESWDPKPRTDTGGPFRAIPTAVPGVHLSELLPYTAQQLHRIALVRGINTQENDHGKGRYFMETGRRQEPVLDYPELGAVAAKYLAPEGSVLPGHIRISPGGNGLGKQDAAFLGPRFASVTLGNGEPPSNCALAEGLSGDAARRRSEFRRRQNDRFNARRRTAETDAYAQSYEQAEQLMAQREIFDIANEPAAQRERYGEHDFGRHCLLARRLFENGITFCRVSHSNYDTHHENFNFHIEQLGEFDRTFATLLDDLAERGMLDSTLVVVMSEFGRTPRINHQYGRDHWGTAWSVALAGCGIQPGAVVGKTNDNGTEVVERQVHAGHLFHTYLTAVGLDPTEDYDADLVGGRPIPLADPDAEAIEELLA